MALPYHALKQIRPHLYGARVLSLGYPDITATPEEVEKLFHYKPTKFTDESDWHHVKHKMPQTEELLDVVNAKLTVVDFVAERGMEVIADLNEPQDFGEFDVVIDPGTLEHCFNFGQAMKNAAQSVRENGVIYHISPMMMMNHGFFNLCPTLFHDFYTQNNWKIEVLAVSPTRNIDYHAVQRFGMGQDFNIACMATRGKVEPLRNPIQTKYLAKMEARKMEKAA